MWRQGLLCYQQLCMQQGCNSQWPLMIPNVGRNRMSHCWQCHTKVQQPKIHHPVKCNNSTVIPFCNQWKKKRGYWRRSHRKKQSKCWCTGHHQDRCCGTWQCCHSYYSSRKQLFRRRRLLAFMCAAIKGRLRPMNVCGWRAPGMRAPRNTTQFIIHQVYQDMRQEQKKAAAAAAKKKNEDKSELQLSIEDNCWEIVDTSTSCIATISAMTPQRGIFPDDEVKEGKSSWRSQASEHVNPESHLSISCEQYIYKIH